MPLYMDIHHKIDGLTADAIKGAHEQDLKVQHKHGVTYHKYWFDEGSGKAFCLVEAPNKDAANAVHREAHGLMADELTEVQEGAERPKAVLGYRFVPFPDSRNMSYDGYRVSWHEPS